MFIDHSLVELLISLQSLERQSLLLNLVALHYIVAARNVGLKPSHV